MLNLFNFIVRDDKSIQVFFVWNEDLVIYEMTYEFAEFCEYGWIVEEKCFLKELFGEGVILIKELQLFARFEVIVYQAFSKFLHNEEGMFEFIVIESEELPSVIFAISPYGFLATEEVQESDEIILVFLSIVQGPKEDIDCI